MMRVTGWFQESRIEVVMKERARAEAKACPEVMSILRTCVAVRLLVCFETIWQ